MQSYRSEVNPNHEINADTCVVSLVVKPRGKNPEHAIIIVEMLVENKACCRRYDFVVDGWPESPEDRGAYMHIKYQADQLKRYDGMVIMKECSQPLDKTSIEDNQAVIKNLFWEKMMKDMYEREGCKGLSW